MTTINNKYSKAKIYRLVNDVDDKQYIGSTIQTLPQRKSGHKRKATTETERRVYKHLNQVGWDNVAIVLIETFPCNNIDELLARERYWIEELKPELNKQLPTRTAKEREKQYREENKEKIKVKDAKKWQKYKEANKEKIAERGRKYWEANREAINERQRLKRLEKKQENS